MKPHRRVKPFTYEGMKVDWRMVQQIMAHGFYFLLAPEHDPDYPWVFEQETHKPICPLHVFVWMQHHGPINQGHVIHHRDHDKLNAQISNLEVLHRRVHAERHRLERQKFSPREREDYGGLYRPHAPGPVREPSFTELVRLLKRGKLTRPSSSSSPRPPEEEGEFREAEKKLKTALPRLAEEVDHLDSGQPIPRVNTQRRGSDIKLGLGKRAERRGCTPAEAALVRALVKHRMHTQPNEAVAADLEIPVGVVEKMKKRPSVDLALSRWRDYRRLPRIGPREKTE